jgi:uncharacterized protein YuzE
MRFHYDKKEDALYLRFSETPYQKSEEVQEGIIFDYDKNNKLIGIEILNASQKFPSKLISQFLKRKLPLTLILESKPKLPV